MRPAPLYRRFDSPLTPEGNSYLHAWAAKLLADPLPGVLDIIPAYASLYLEYDADLLTARQAEDWLDGHAPAAWNMIEQDMVEHGTAAGREVRIPVLYDGEDLPSVAAATGLSVPEVIALHSGTPYRVYAQGFVAGFPFLGEVAPALRLPRRASPRAQVPAHSVAMAASQTGVYPVASPGGWHLLGHALEAVYDPNRTEPFLLGPGDTVRFVPAAGPIPPPVSPLELLPAAPAHPLLQVERSGPLSLVQDAGRVLAGRFGLVRGGFASPQAAQIANRLLGNAPDAPLLELHLGGPGCTVLTDCTLAVSGFGPQARLDGVPALPWSSFRARAGQRLDFRAGGSGRAGPGGSATWPSRAGWTPHASGAAPAPICAAASGGRCGPETCWVRPRRASPSRASPRRGSRCRADASGLFRAPVPPSGCCPYRAATRRFWRPCATRSGRLATGTGWACA